MNEIVKFTSDSGQAVEITPQDVKRVLCPSATDKEIALFLELCKAQRLNPWIKDAYLIKYGSQNASIVTGKEVFTKRANANKSYQGFEAGVTFIANGKVQHREGSAVYREAGETLIGGWCRVYVDGRKPFYDEVTLSEYSTGKSNWQKMPATMIRKVALVHCLREAFPDDFQGLYAAEEMGSAGQAAMTQESAPMPAQAAQQPAQEPIKAEFVEMASDSQNAQILDLVDDFAKMRGKDSAAVLSAVFSAKSCIAAGIEAGREFTAAQADLVMELLESWIAKAEEQENAEAAEAIAAKNEAESVTVDDMPQTDYVHEGDYYENDVVF